MPLPEPPLHDSTFGRLLELTQSEIRALLLTGIAQERVVINKLGWFDPEIDPMPRVIIEPRPELVRPDEGTNEQDDITYNVMVSMVFADARDVSTHLMGLALYWREVVRKHFHNEHEFTNLSLAAGSFLNRTTVEPGEIYIEEGKRRQLDAQYLLIRYLVREDRT